MRQETSMSQWKKAAAVLGTAMLLAAAVFGQETAKPSPQQFNPLKITIVVHEFKGKQELARLPYELAIAAVGTDQRAKSTGRIGTRVPIETEKGQYTYLDIGTNYDCFVRAQGDGRYHVEVTLERSSVIAPEVSERNRQAAAGEHHTINPPIQTLRLSFDLVLGDGDTAEGSMSTDPLTGHVWRVDVGLKVLK
jgi:hypothetical protein